MADVRCVEFLMPIYCIATLATIPVVVEGGVNARMHIRIGPADGVYVENSFGGTEF